jgi:hypothetical protein
VVLELVCKVAEFPREMVCQHLDDICAAAPEGSRVLSRFDEVFRQVAEQVGVKLADRADPEKTFAPCKRGTVLGVEYDTEAWTWTIPQEKLVRLRQAVREVLGSDQVTVRAAQSLVGKLLHIRPLLPAAKFNMAHIMLLSAEANRHDNQNVRIQVTVQARRQLAFWLLLLEACPGHLAIPREVVPMPWALHAFTDAAGGSLDRLGAGTGGVLGEWWFYVPWAKRINAGGWRIEGKKVGRKLSALELVGPLVTVAAGHHLLRNKQVIIWVDNAGAVAIWNKGYSTRCALSSTIVSAISAVAAAIGCTVFIKKIARCSAAGAVMADHLSKANFQWFRQHAAQVGWRLQVEPARVPVTLLRWIDKLVQSDDLAHDILRELARDGPILNYSV